jgi:DNA polymerase-3 subunit delta'
MAEGRFPHAFLFVGPEGVGKRTFAFRLAQALLCETRPETDLDPCGACAACHQVAAQTHPDFLVVGRPEDKHDLPIAVVRQLSHDIGLRPARGGRKIAIVDDADDMNDEAANALLKTLEEPPPDSVLVLLGTAAEVQLETIVSRCRIVRFGPLSEDDLKAVLRGRGIAGDESEAARLAALGEGSVARAQGLADPALIAFRRQLIDQLARPGGIDAPALSRSIETFVKEAGKESVDQRGRAALLAVELANFFRGVLWQTVGLETPAADLADRRAAAALAERLEPEDVFFLTERCLDAHYHVQRKAYMPLVLDALMSDLGQALRRRETV